MLSANHDRSLSSCQKQYGQSHGFKNWFERVFGEVASSTALGSSAKFKDENFITLVA